MTAQDPAPPADPDTRAFVLRVRRTTETGAMRALVDLEDAQTTQTWRFTSLEAAFDQIRQTIILSGALPGSSAKRH